LEEDIDILEERKLQLLEKPTMPSIIEFLTEKNQKKVFYLVQKIESLCKKIPFLFCVKKNKGMMRKPILKIAIPPMGKLFCIQ